VSENPLVKVLHLFSGPSSRKDGISSILNNIGCSCVDVDIVNTSEGMAFEQCDLTSDHLWRDLVSRVSKSEFTFVWMGTPCTTFSVARQGPPGPVPLRTVERPYGRPKSELSQSDMEALTQGNYFAFKSAHMAWTCLAHGIGFAIENPEPWADSPSLFKLPEFLELESSPLVNVVNFDQCTLGAETKKPTRILHSGIDLSSMHNRCNHFHQQWNFKGWNGQPKTSFGAHPPLFGRLRESGEPATKASAAYPYELNKAIVWSVLKAKPRTPPAPHQS
jgi:hypothetical protein